MWRLNSISGNSKDSDQSISDEEEDEEHGYRWTDRIVSLAGTVDLKKESLGVASQLDLLKGVRQDTSFSSEDEVEIPEFYDESNANDLCIVEGDSVSLKIDASSFGPDEQRSSVQKGCKSLFESVIEGDNVPDTFHMHTRGKEKGIEYCTQSTNHKESTRLDPLTETGKWPTHHPVILNGRNPSKGGRRKSVAGPSYHVEPDKKTILRSFQRDKDSNSKSSDELLDESEAIDSWTKEKINHFKCSHEEISDSRFALPVGAPMQHNDSRSMVELLDHLQGKHIPPQPYQNCKTGARRNGRIRRHDMIRDLPSSLDNLMSDEDAGEFMNSGSSTENEDIAQKPVIVGSGRQTMADKFQEAFGSPPVLDRRPSFMAPKLSSSGLSGRLLQVMLRQKEQDREFLKKQQTEVWPEVLHSDEARCIDVKILSRSFDAKLTVCHCSLLENEESSVQNPHQESFQKTWTIIFNSRVCGDVDLEVGNLVRVHPPWHEVQVLRCGEIIILATYFSHMTSYVIQGRTF